MHLNFVPAAWTRVDHRAACVAHDVVTPTAREDLEDKMQFYKSNIEELFVA